MAAGCVLAESLLQKEGRDSDRCHFEAPQRRFWKLVRFFFFPEMETLSVARLEYSGATSAHFNLQLPGSSISWVAEITGTQHHAQLIFVFLAEIGFYYIGQDGLDLLTSWSTCLDLPKCWDYRLEPLRPAPFIVFLLHLYDYSLFLFY